MDLRDLIRDILTELNELSDPERQEWAKTNFPTSMTVKGIPLPKIRPIIKQMSKRFKKSSPEEVVEFSKQLNATRILEAQQIAVEVLYKHKVARQSLTLDDLNVFGKGMDNWGSVDYFACLLAGPAWREGQITDEVIEEWAASADKWWRRAAVVCTVALNQKARGGTGDAVRTLKICKLVAGDKDDMVAKGLSWALRELAKREVEPVIEFVDKYETKLPKRVIREVRRKIETGRKYG